MKKFKQQITLNKNSRGCYILDTIKGCSICLNGKPSGCYDNCYAKNISLRYGFDFSSPVKRDFSRDKEQLYMFNLHDEKHQNKIIKKISNIEMSFVRIGEMGDPSEDWEHTVNICEIISHAKKPIVIITKHWKTITNDLLKIIEKLKVPVYINTSISALDDDYEVDHRLNQYHRLKYYCNSVLRVVSCNFNKKNKQGFIRTKLQDELFKYEDVVDTIFRPDKNNPLVTKNIINVKRVKFLKSNVLASVYNKNTYMGHCKDCPDMCGVKI
jgi:hypothetical protein